MEKVKRVVCTLLLSKSDDLGMCKDNAFYHQSYYVSMITAYEVESTIATSDGGNILTRHQLYVS